MTPKEKAKQLVNSIYETLLKNDHLQSYKAAKECASIAVDEIIKKHYDDWDEHSDYWQEVKQEIEKS